MSVDELRPGENRVLPTAAVDLQVGGSGTPQCWLVTLDAQGAATGEPFGFTGSLRVDLAALGKQVQRVMILSAVSTRPAELPSVEMRCGTAVLRFAGSGVPGSALAVLVEFYRRDGSWKVRALGQGYATVAAAETNYRTTFPTTGTAPAGQPPPQGEQIHWAGTIPDQHSHGGVEELQRQIRTIFGIWEDASRSAATYAESDRFAGLARDNALEHLIADPTARAADHPGRVAADRQYDDVMRRAADRRLQELDHLSAELSALESTLPAALARWTSPSWKALPSNGCPVFRVGELKRPDSTVLTIPMIRERAPQGGHLLLPWESGRLEGAAVLLARIIAAGPAGRGVLVLSDDSGIAQELGVPAARIPFGQQLDELVRALDLADMAAEASHLDATDIELVSMAALPSVVVIPIDPSTVSALTEDQVGHLRRVALLGPQYGVATVFTAGDDLRNCFGPGVPGPLLVLSSAQVEDPWVGSVWDFTPDSGPGGALAQVLNRRMGDAGS